MKPTLKDCAAFLEISEDAIEAYCKKIGTSFTEFRDKNMVHTRFMVIRNIIKQCEKGSIPMLIYASKNLCGWKDKWDVDLDHSSSDGSMTPRAPIIDIRLLSNEQLALLENVLRP